MNYNGNLEMNLGNPKNLNQNIKKCWKGQTTQDGDSNTVTIFVLFKEKE